MKVLTLRVSLVGQTIQSNGVLQFLLDIWREYCLHSSLATETFAQRGHKRSHGIRFWRWTLLLRSDPQVLTMDPWHTNRDSMPPISVFATKLCGAQPALTYE